MIFQMNVETPAFRGGPGKQMAYLTFYATSSGLVEAGMIDPAQQKQILKELEAFTEDPLTMMSLPRIFQVTALS